MVATDTIVGVAGAVLLAAVMVGVFVYEYNNAPADGPIGGNPTPDDKIAAFNAAYPDLDAQQDLDGDGLANFDDPDLDSTGGPDLSQTGDFIVRSQMDGSSANPPAANVVHSKTFTIGAGGRGLHAELNYTPTLPPLQGLPRAPTFDLVLVTPDGTEVRGQAGPVSGNQVNLRLNLDSVPAGNYTMTVEQTTAGPDTDYGANWAINYGPAKPAA